MAGMSMAGMSAAASELGGPASNEPGRGGSPKVSIGLPVYNGELYLDEAVASLLGQTFADLELVISDNASTDGTEEICRAWAARDPRVRYHRNATNLGAAANYDRVLAMARGELFKWAAHDDVLGSTFLAQAVEVLDAAPSVVLVHPRAAAIDAAGHRLGEFEPVSGFYDARPHVRFRRALAVGEEIYLVWGLARRAELRAAGGLGNHIGHDLTLLSALSMRGRFHEVPEVLIFQREHPGRSVNRYDWRRPRQAIEWFDPALTGRRISPWWRQLAEHAKGIRRARLGPLESARCAWELRDWSRRHRHELWSDLVLRTTDTPVLGPLVDRFDRRGGDVRSVVPEGATLLLVDDDEVETEIFGERRTRPFLEKDGMSWGAPPDDEVAVAELERMRREGASFLVITAGCRWWLEHYQGFADHLHRRYRQVLDNDRYIIFDLL
jgi:glycosyltransferase involved in cell wall biosynthesis